VRSRYERVAATALETKGYEIFLPTYRKPGAVARRALPREEPLFPGYLFCRIVFDLCAKIVVTPGVIRIVSFGREPVAVSEDEIAAIHRVIKSRVERQPCQYMPAGSRVRVESGPLCGIEGVLASDGRNRRIVLSINLLQRSVEAVLEPDTVLTRVPAAFPRERSGSAISV